MTKRDEENEEWKPRPFRLISEGKCYNNFVVIIH